MTPKELANTKQVFRLTDEFYQIIFNDLTELERLKNQESETIRQIELMTESFEIVIPGDPVPVPLAPCYKCKKPRGEDGHGAYICPCPHCGDEIPF